MRAKQMMWFFMNCDAKLKKTIQEKVKSNKDRWPQYTLDLDNDDGTSPFEITINNGQNHYNT